MKRVEIISHNCKRQTISWTGLIDFTGECHPKGKPGFVLHSENIQDIENIKRVHKTIPEAFNLVEENASITVYPTEGARIIIHLSLRYALLIKQTFILFIFIRLAWSPFLAGDWAVVKGMIQLLLLSSMILLPLWYYFVQDIIALFPNTNLGKEKRINKILRKSDLIDRIIAEEEDSEKIQKLRSRKAALWRDYANIKYNLFNLLPILGEKGQLGIQR